jgi:hypothetical protein
MSERTLAARLNKHSHLTVTTDSGEEIEVRQRGMEHFTIYYIRVPELGVWTMMDDVKSLDDVYGIILHQWGYDADELEWRPITVNVVKSKTK